MAKMVPADAPDELREAMSENEIEDEGEEGDEGPLSEEDFQGAIKGLVSEASDYIDDSIAPKREKAMRFYRGEPFGNEEEGRSQVVMTEVRDTVQAMLPSLCRVFASSEKPVEFAPRRANKVAEAEQATDYVSYVFNEDNPGFTLFWNGFKDALISKVAVYQWYTADSARILEERYTGLDQGSINLLSQVKGVEVLSIEPDEPGEPALEEMGEAPEAEAGEMDPAMAPEMGMAPLPPQTFSVTLRRRVEKRRQVVECIPPEEFIISPNATSLDDADFVGRRSLKTLSQLLELGYEREEIEEHGVASSVLDLNNETITRNPDVELITGASGTSSDKAMERYLYIEGYARVDKDGDGIAELRRVCALNDSCYILHDEVVEDVKLAVLCPDPEPHMVIGSSIADQVMDLQEIKSNVVRNTLDSLSNSIHPRTEAVEGQVNMDDVLNVETGAVIRVTQPGMVRQLDTPFLGQQAMPIISWLDDVRAARTGISKASQGLDGDVLQSTTKAAVTATVTAAEQRLEMVARIFAETGIKRLFKGLLKEIVQNQDQPRIVRLRNQWVPIDPRNWDPDMDVVVNVGLGNGNSEEKLQILMMVVQKQEQLLQQLGPNNPIVDLKQYRDTLAQILELKGFKDTRRYFKEITPEALQKFQQPQQQQQQPQDPAQILAQVEAEKIRKDMAIADQNAALDAKKHDDEMDLKRDELDADTMLRASELQLKYGAQVQVEQIYAMIQRNRDMDRANIDKMKVEQQAQNQAAQREQQAALAQQKQQMMAQQPPAGVQ
jgi:hypothetical protein